MTRFLMPLSKAVDTVIHAALHANRYNGFTVIPKINSANILNLAKVLIGDRNINTYMIGVRPGEKLHEELISYEEGLRAKYFLNNDYVYIEPTIKERIDLNTIPDMKKYEKSLTKAAYSSQTEVMNDTDIKKLLRDNGLLYEQYCKQNDNEMEEVLG